LRDEAIVGHILRLQEENPGRVALNWEPQKTWRVTFKEDLHAIGVIWRGAKRVVGDRSSDGRNSSPNVPEGTGGTEAKSKSKIYGLL